MQLNTQPQLIRFLLLSLTVCLLIATINFPAYSNLVSERPPNILFILTDDLDQASVEYMPQVKSLLVDGGVSFSNYFVSNSLCCPSRATILKGQYAHNTGVLTNNKADGSFVVFYKRNSEKSTIATWLKRKGYRTAFIGKYLNLYPYTSKMNYVPPGWDEWDSPVHGSAYVQYDYTVNENGKLVHYGNQPQDYGNDVYTNKAKQFLTQVAKTNQPFFLFLSYYAPHQPATPAPRHQNLFPDAQVPRRQAFNEIDVSDKPQYLRELPLLNQEQQEKIDYLHQKRLRSLQAVDEGLATLYNTLQATNQLDNTYIFFSSDNGFHLGQHRLLPGKETAYEEDIHLPLLVRSPHVPAGKVIEAIAGNVDLAPTWADLAGARIPDFVDGRSLVPLFELKLNTTMSPFYFYRRKLRSLLTNSWRQVFLVEHWVNPHVTPIIPQYSGLRGCDYTYIEYVNGEREFYNLRQDPEQLHNLARQTNPKLLAHYAQLLRQLRNCQRKDCRVTESRKLIDFN
ncbi:N-acetylglucosamine-6-sulfatase [Stanieria cyanosphaera PCC 7437]|uniref:N-acetylglucosamine-6-sulfatase n=1 Tax=Stanieria cyanosphaera (strain ATCC 29371 / PCC 7437) TaxID=111780 RepID=K9XV48_STAC7|nr:sulfatase-like hydrolase/transferase [Stanieria cyanosphaera]AFZ35939.1 N-acetylglucosamine-6-sulfatase [Stanieria cyanosphaera PCC 7437]